MSCRKLTQKEQCILTRNLTDLLREFPYAAFAINETQIYKDDKRKFSLAIIIRTLCFFAVSLDSSPIADINEIQLKTIIVISSILLLGI